MARVKCCGMFRDEDIDAVNAAGPDYCGFVVDFPASRRSVEPGRVGQLSGRLSPGIMAVGVFVDEDPAVVADLVKTGAIEVVQLHGHEDDAYLTRLRGLLPQGTFVIQAFQVRGPEDVERANQSKASMVLLDAGQGSGQSFDWSLLAGVTRRYILAGGLTPDNVAQAVRTLDPWGVDLSSGLETDGLKDPDKIKAAVAAVRGA